MIEIRKFIGNEKFQCATCPKVFASLETFDKHQKKHRWMPELNSLILEEDEGFENCSFRQQCPDCDGSWAGGSVTDPCPYCGSVNFGDGDEGYED